MSYVRDSFWSAYYPKLLGTYEKELATQIESIVTSNPAVVVDVGAAEGYYAVGLALRLPGAKVIAFESESKARAMLDELCEINRCSGRVVIRERCTSSDLVALAREHRRGTLIMDVEGGEVSLLASEVVAAFRDWIVLVELHEVECPGCDATLWNRFAASHDIVAISSVARRAADFPIPAARWVHHFFRAQVLRSMNEWRPTRMKWLYMVPHQPAGR